MKKAVISSGITGIIVAGAMIVPGTASAVTTGDLARADCRMEKREDPREFKREFGTGKAAIKRCTTREIKQARRECRFERRYESAEFKREYGGTGKQALRRCVRSELL